MLRFVAFLLAAALLACHSESGSSSSEDGGPDTSTDAARTDGGGADGGSDGGWVDSCPDEAKLVYVVDENNTFSSFNPIALRDGGTPFKDLGKLSCPAARNETPFSMSVARDATAWVVYTDGELFRVNTSTLACEKAEGYQPDPECKVFGMGFVSNSPGSQDETLYVAGRAAQESTGDSSVFGSLQLSPSVALHRIGTTPGRPELTGTGDAKLWGFFPDQTASRVAPIDVVTGALGTPFPANGLEGDPREWAFAFWGGDFWIFLRRQTDASTNVHRMHSSNGALDTPVPNTGRRIVGAGVSTCAPVEPPN